MHSKGIYEQSDKQHDSLESSTGEKGCIQNKSNNKNVYTWFICLSGLPTIKRIIHKMWSIWKSNIQQFQWKTKNGLNEWQHTNNTDNDSHLHAGGYQKAIFNSTHRFQRRIDSIQWKETKWKAVQRIFSHTIQKIESKIGSKFSIEFFSKTNYNVSHMVRLQSVCWNLWKFSFEVRTLFDSGYFLIISFVFRDKIYYFVYCFDLSSIFFFWKTFCGLKVSDCCHWKSNHSFDSKESAIIGIIEKLKIQKHANIVEKSHKKMHTQPKKTESCERYCFEY